MSQGPSHHMVSNPSNQLSCLEGRLFVWCHQYQLLRHLTGNNNA